MAKMKLRVGWKSLGALVLQCLLAAAAPLAAQSPADLHAREKTEVFIQHLAKVAKIDPSRYQALVLEYEIGNALTELSAGLSAGQSAAEGDESPKEKGSCGASGVGANFIDRALKEIHPEYARAAQLKSEGKVAEARQAAQAIESHPDPYLAAHARLLLAELAFEEAQAAGESRDNERGNERAYEKVISLAEKIGQNDRLYLLKDHRACELIAISFEKLKKPLLEMIQYALLLTDYDDLPPEVEGRAKTRLAALDGEFGRPLTTVSIWMNKVEKLLNREITGKEPTQKEEKEIVSALDKFIELQEARERKT
jgi:hypothetical protein